MPALEVGIRSAMLRVTLARDASCVQRVTNSQPKRRPELLIIRKRRYFAAWLLLASLSPSGSPFLLSPGEGGRYDVTLQQDGGYARYPARFH